MNRVLVLAAMTIGWSAVALADPAADASVTPVAPQAAQPAPEATGASPPVQAPARTAPVAPSTPQQPTTQPPPAQIAPMMLRGKPWELTSTGDGITTYKRDVPGSDIIALRGVGTIAAPIARVASVLLDYSRAQEWVDDLELVRVIRWIGPAEFIEYDRLGTPPLIMKDRDFVCRGKLAVDVREQSLVMTVEPATDPKAPPYSRYVRGELRGFWKLKAIDGGKHTLIVAEMHGDPKGGVPKWLVNLFQRGWARSTVESLRKQVAKPDVQVMPQIKAVLEGKSVAFAIKSK